MVRRILPAAACLIAPGLPAQDSPTARVFCDPADPANRCPGTECRCSEDVLAIRFERSGGPILEVDDEPGLLIEATVVLETRSAGVQGFSYGVRHDGRALTIENVTTDETDAGRVFFAQGFDPTRFEDLEDCTADPGPRCSNRLPGNGFISATVLDSVPGELPLGTNSLARATYRLEPTAAAVNEAGLFLEFTERLAKRNAPPTAINLTIFGRSAGPRTLADGKIIVRPRPFHRGDPDGDGRLSVADAALLLLFLFLAGPAPGCLDAADADDDGRIDATDPVLILRWLFASGTAPAPPGPPPAPCGRDPEGPGPGLGCDAYGACFR
jgi:hypothetical protein